MVYGERRTAAGGYAFGGCCMAAPVSVLSELAHNSLCLKVVVYGERRTAAGGIAFGGCCLAYIAIKHEMLLKVYRKK